MRYSHLTTRRLVAALAFVAALIAAGFASPRSALAGGGGLPIDGNICGFSTNSAGGYFLVGVTGSVVTVTVTSSNGSGVIIDNGSGLILNISGAGTYSGTVTLTDSSFQPGFYFLSAGGGGGSLTVTTSCGAQNISTDGRLNNDGAQGAQSVSLYCNADGSIKMIPLQLKVPGPGSVSMKKAGTNDDLVLTSAKLSTIKQTTSYAYGITITPNSDGSWTVRRLELTTTKTYAYIIPAHSCGN